MEVAKIHDHIERLSNLLRAESRRTGAVYGLQPIQLEALHYLSTCNRYSDTPMGVTEYLGQTKGTVSQTINLLARKGLLSKHTDKNDKRITHLKVSAKGKKILGKAIPSSLFISACEQLSEKSQQATTKILHDLLKAIQLSNGSKSFGVCHSCRYNKKNENGTFYCKLVEEALSQNDVQLICREHSSIA